MKQSLPASLHLVAQPSHVLQGDLGLGGQRASALQRQGLGRLEAHLLPLQGAGRLLSRYRAQVDRQVHRRSGGHQSLQEAGGQRPGPLAEVERADEAVSDTHVAAVDLDFYGRLLGELGRRTAECRRYEEHSQLSAPQGVDRQSGPRQQSVKLVDARELAHGVEAPVEDAVAGLKVGEQPSKRLGSRLRLWWQVFGLGPLQALPHPVQARRVLPDEELRGEVEGVERAREGPQLRFVDLEAHHLAYADLHPVEPHGPVVLEVGQHEEEGQYGEELALGFL